MLTPAFRPHPLVRGGQLQTLAGQFLPYGTRPGPHHVETVPLSAGDQLLLHVNEPPGGSGLGQALGQDAAHSPLILLLHGLGGSSESSYVLRIAYQLNRLGYTALRFNHRGCGPGGAPLARGIYHAGRIEDVDATAKFIGQRWPGRPLYAVAFSLSANMLLRYLGEVGAAHHPHWRRALAVCPPIDLEACSEALSRSANWHIDRYFTRLLVRTAHARGLLFPDLPAPAWPPRLNLRAFDEVYTAPGAGFASRAAYYRTSSARDWVRRIELPTGLIAAADDPIIPPASFAGVTFSGAVQVRIEAAGGHMGFISADRTRFGNRRWLDAAVVDWVEAGAAAAPASTAR